MMPLNNTYIYIYIIKSVAKIVHSEEVNEVFILRLSYSINLKKIKISFTT